MLALPAASIDALSKSKHLTVVHHFYLLKYCYWSFLTVLEMIKQTTVYSLFNCVKMNNYQKAFVFFMLFKVSIAERGKSLFSYVCFVCDRGCSILLACTDELSYLQAENHAIAFTITQSIGAIMDHTRFPAHLPQRYFHISANKKLKVSPL